MPTAADIVDLRRLLNERFPQAHSRAAASAPQAAVPTGVPPLDALLGGGLPRGEVTELVGDGPGSGTAQVLHALIRQTALSGQFLALIDGADSLDLDPIDNETLTRLLWVRCPSASMALKAVDILLRDRNFPLVVLDLKLNPATELRGIRASVWPRLDRLREHQGTTLLVITPQPLVSGVAVRVRLSRQLDLSMTREDAGKILWQLHFDLERHGASQASPSAKRVA